MERNKVTNIPFDPESLGEQMTDNKHIHAEKIYGTENPHIMPEEESDLILEEDFFETPQYEKPIEGEGP